ncbi:MAG TPA: Obg family GTPase CgtA, partial [Candidatus Saccharimonadales bacterium]|nr:Obg family GTPase CgtA [Candidatus Saccharimonadales bacterium]
KAEKQAEKTGIPVITLTDTTGQWKAVKDGEAFVITGPKIEQFAKRTDFTNDEAVQRLRDIMKKMGIMHELLRQDVLPGQTIRIGDHGSFSY